MIDEQALQDVVEAKLTKTELIELVLEDVEGDIRSRMHEAQKAYDKAKEKVADLLPAAHTMPLKPRVEISKPYDWRKNQTRTVTVTWTVKRDSFPKSILSVWDEQDAARAKNDAASEELSTFNANRKRAKLAIVRQSLAATVSGKRVLKMMDDFRAAASKRLLTAG